MLPVLARASWGAMSTVLFRSRAEEIPLVDFIVQACPPNLHVGDKLDSSLSVRFKDLVDSSNRLRG